MKNSDMSAGSVQVKLRETGFNTTTTTTVEDNDKQNVVQRNVGLDHISCTKTHCMDTRTESTVYSDIFVKTAGLYLSNFSWGVRVSDPQTQSAFGPTRRPQRMAACCLPLMVRYHPQT